MQYKVGGKNRSNHFLDFEVLVDTRGKKNITLALSKWRPGRYEMGNFAKNISGFAVFNLQGKKIPFKKITSHSWLIECKGIKQFIVRYNYYANELNAGSTFVDDNQFYLNPVNCCIYEPEEMEQSASIAFDVPKNYIFATSLSPINNHTYEAKNFDELADSPIIASANLKHGCYKVNNTDFHMWFQGECRPEWKKLIPDFIAFTEKQLQVMGTFPFKTYHFLFQITPYASYHGVEHLSSTVLLLGPGFDTMNPKLYDELLGISSHELFHSWNVKSIRPIEMVPYDYSQENYTEMGYLTEGVTTYYGDLFLKLSGVFETEQLFALFHTTLDRHSFNYGRFNYSVSESSFDTWLDGYAKGIPNRKTSIYVEGSLLALCLDIEIIAASKGKNSLDQAMRKLYEQNGNPVKGIQEQDWVNAISEAAGQDFTNFFYENYKKPIDLFEPLRNALSKVGIELYKESHPSFTARQFGILIDSKNVVQQMAPSSPAENAGIAVGDEIIAINNIPCKENAEKWLNYFSDDCVITVNNNFSLKNLTCKTTENTASYFPKYRMKELKNKTKLQEKLYEKWLNR